MLNQTKDFILCSKLKSVSSFVVLVESCVVLVESSEREIYF